MSLVAHSQVSEAILLGNWSDSTLVGSSAYNNTYNEVWGLTNNGMEYAVIGSTFGTHILDISDPTNPRVVVEVKGGSSGAEIIHRDYHDYNGYLFAVADEGSNSTLQIMDFSYLPDSVHIVYDSKQYLRTTHNIFIDTSTAIMYACISRGDQAPWTALRLFDISDPGNPSVLANYDEFDGYRISQVHDMYIRDHIAFLNCGPSGFVMADFSDPLAPVTLAILETDDYPQSGYNHSGWLSDDGNIYYMADENWGADIKVMDVSQLPEITVIDTIDAESDSPYSIPHNQIVHNGFLFGSHYYDGLQVWDIRDPYNITRVLHYPTSNITPRASYEGAWGVYPFLPSGVVLVSDMQNGLFILGIPLDLVGTDEPDTFTSNIDLVPNPSDGRFRILNEGDQIERIFLWNAKGEFVRELQYQDMYNLDLENGVYYVQIIDGHQLLTKKLLIAK